MRFLGFLLLASATKPSAAEVGNGLKQYSDSAYDRVENTCAVDVETLCAPKEEFKPMFMLSGDPFLDWMFLPSASIPTPPEASDLNLFIDLMFNSILLSTAFQGSSTLIFEVESSPQSFVDLGVARLAAEKEPDEIPQLAYQLQTYGASLLRDSEDGSERHRMARRLTEMDTNTINYHVQLPFGPKNCCLRSAFENQMVSEECARSITILEKTFLIEEQFNMMWIIITSLALLATLLALSVKCGEESIGEVIEEDAYYAMEDCCDEEDVQHKRILPVKKIVVEGVPVQIV